jgi:hypothetical protein
MFQNESTVCAIKIPRRDDEKIVDAVFCPQIKRMGVLIKGKPAVIYNAATLEKLAEPVPFPATGLAFRAVRQGNAVHEVALSCGEGEDEITRYDYLRKVKIGGLFMPRAQSIAYSYSGHLLAAGSSEGFVRIWTLKGEAREAVNVKIASSAVTRLSFSFQGGLLLATTARGDLYAINARGEFSAVKLGSPDDPPAQWDCHTVASHPLAKVSAFAGAGNAVNVFYAGLNKVIRFETYQENRYIRQLQFQSSSSKLLAVGDIGVEVWNLSDTYELLTQWSPQSGRVLSASFCGPVIFAAVD